MEETLEKKSFMETFTDKVTEFTTPLAIFAQRPAMQAIQEGFAATLPLLMLGSLFLIAFAAVNGQLGFTIAGGLAAVSGTFLIPFNLTTGLLGLYATVAIGTAYARRLDLQVTNAVLIVLSFFFFISYNDVSEGLALTPLSTNGMFVGMFGSILCIWVYNWFIKNNIGIKLPDTVPAGVANAFTSLIPYCVILVFAWVVRTLLNFDVMNAVMGLLAPILNMADNVGVFALSNTLSGICWSVGLHYENLTSAIITPMTTGWLAENSAAFAAGTPLSELPHIWTYGMSIWTTRAIVNYPVAALLLRSKVPGFKEMGVAAALPAIFCICEPLNFGTPVVMNPFLMIPLILSNFVGSFLIYGAFQLGFVNRCYTSSPWAAPSTLSGYLQTADWRCLILLAVLLVVGICIYYPFFRAFEKDTLKKQAAEEAAQLAA